jgi:hypothetical protein
MRSTRSRPEPPSATSGKVFWPTAASEPSQPVFQAPTAFPSVSPPALASLLGFRTHTPTHPPTLISHLDCTRATILPLGLYITRPRFRPTALYQRVLVSCKQGAMSLGEEGTPLQSLEIVWRQRKGA